MDLLFKISKQWKHGKNIITARVLIVKLYKKIDFRYTIGYNKFAYCQLGGE